MKFSIGQRVQLVDYPNDYTKQLMQMYGIPLRYGRKGTVVGEEHTKSGDYIKVHWDGERNNYTSLCGENELAEIKATLEEFTNKVENQEV